jgi:hypothetical protein
VSSTTILIIVVCLAIAVVGAIGTVKERARCQQHERQEPRQ